MAAYSTSRSERSPGLEGDQRLQDTIIRLLAERGPGKSICPSEAARAIAGSEDRDTWRALLAPIRKAADDLVAQNRIVITQHGRVVDGAAAKGPVRLRSR